MSERLQKVLARAGVASRRKSEDLITAGRVRVNGKPAELGMKVTDEDELMVDGQRVERDVKLVTYLLNKPEGVVSTVDDERNRQTVMDLVPVAAGLHPVGRLDRDSEGMLLLTNDGDLTLELTHPRYEHEKEYRVWCREGTPNAGALATLEQGVELEDGIAKVVVARVAEGGCRVVLGEGRNRQVRRMLAAVGYRVTRLVRVRIGGLELGNLAVGGYRKLSAADFKKLGYTPKGSKKD